jgi:hypothetical protein
VDRTIAFPKDVERRTELAPSVGFAVPISGLGQDRERLLKDGHGIAGIPGAEQGRRQLSQDAAFPGLISQVTDDAKGLVVGGERVVATRASVDEREVIHRISFTVTVTDVTAGRGCFDAAARVRICVAAKGAPFVDGQACLDGGIRCVTRPLAVAHTGWPPQPVLRCRHGSGPARW